MLLLLLPELWALKERTVLSCFTLAAPLTQRGLPGRQQRWEGVGITPKHPLCTRLGGGIRSEDALGGMGSPWVHTPGCWVLAAGLGGIQRCSRRLCLPQPGIESLFTH